MEIRQLVTFMKIAEENSFSKAAKQLGYSQSAVTVQIRLLEQELGTKLFERIGSCSRMTEKGRQLQPYAARILNEAEEAKRELSASEPLRAVLRIGAVESLCMTKLPPILQYFRRYLPQVSLRVVTADSAALLAEMEQNRLDLIYLLDEPLYSDKWEKPLNEPEQLVFVSSPAFAASHKQFCMKDLMHEPFLLTEKDSDCRRALGRLLALAKLDLEPVMELHDRALILRMLKECHSISFLPYFVVQADVEAGSLAVLDLPDLQTVLYRQIFYHRDKYLTRAMHTFIQLAGGMLPERI